MTFQKNCFLLLKSFPALPKRPDYYRQQAQKGVRKNTPKGSTGKLKKGWKHKVEGYNGSELTYELVNRHPVHHLLNNGHVKKTPGGRTVGYYEGRHYTEKSVKQFEASDLQPGLERLTKKLLKKAGGT